jgi:glycerophosphoryl diester phosphodiesterase
MDGQPLVIARTGDVENAPENTLLAFESAIVRGADGVELDVHLSSDGELVVHHFYSLGTTDDGEGLVCEHTLGELKALDSGGWYDERFAGQSKPALREVFELCKDRVRLEVHLHDSSLRFLRQVVEEVERFDLVDDVELTTAHYPLLAHVKELNPELRTGTFYREPPEWTPIRLAQRHIVDWATLLGTKYVHLDVAFLSHDFVSQLRRRGFIVHGSNLDAREEIERGLNAGVGQFSTGCLGMALQLRDEFVESRA